MLPYVWRVIVTICIAELYANVYAYAGAIKHVFVISMENRDADVIYRDASKAPYIHDTLLPNYAHATNFVDELPGLPSEPHYIWMEAGTNRFTDHTFNSDADPIAAHRTNITGSKDHLVSQMKAANVSWTTYQEGLDSKYTGACPIVSSGHTFYAAKHNPFVFFRDISGDPPSSNNAECISHTRPYTELRGDMHKNVISNYVFITPNLCNDMHGAVRCETRDPVKRGDDWLKMELPPIIEWARKNKGVIFITWDEGDRTKKMPFIAIGSGVKAGYSSYVLYDHGSMLKSIEMIFGLPLLRTVVEDNDLSDLFRKGMFP